MNLENIKYLVIPILHNNHFTLVFANFETKKFIYLDPLEEKSIISDELFLKFLKILNMVNINTEGWQNFEIPHDLQKDTFNCGVFVCQFSEKLINDQYDLKNLTDQNIYRKYMQSEIIKFLPKNITSCLHWE